MASFVSSSLKTGKLILVWALVSLHHLPHQQCWEPSNLSDCDDTNEAFNTGLLLLLNLQSREGEGGWGGISLWSLLCQLWSQPLCGLWGWLMVKTAISRVVFLGRITCTVESEWLQGQQMWAWLPWPSHLYQAFCDGQGDCLLAFLYS